MDYLVPELVAPSRGRGSKRVLVDLVAEREWSLPHGGADRNWAEVLRVLKPGASLPHGARIETFKG